MLKVKTVMVFFGIFSLKMMGLLLHDVKAKDMKLSHFWIFYGVVIRLTAVVGLHAWGTNAPEYKGDKLSLLINGAIVAANFLATIVSSCVLPFKSKKLAAVIQTTVYQDEEFWSFYTLRRSIRMETFILVCMSGAFTAVAKTFVATYPTSLPLWIRVILLYSMSIFVGGSLISILAFHCLCHALLGGLRSSKLCLQNGTEKFFNGQEAIEKFETSLHRVERKKIEIVEIFKWNITMLIMGSTVMISFNIVLIALLGFDLVSFMFILPPTQIMCLCYLSGQTFINEVNSIRVDFTEASVKWTADLQSPAGRVVAQLQQMADFSISGAYSLKLSSLVAVLNAGIGWVVLLLQVSFRNSSTTLTVAPQSVSFTEE